MDARHRTRAQAGAGPLSIAGGVWRPGGVFVTPTLRRCRGDVVAGKRFPSADVREDDLRGVLEPRLSASIEVRELAGHEAQGYAGIVLASGVCRS